MAYHGPDALDWFIQRSNSLFKENSGTNFSLAISYYSIFCQPSKETQEQAYPVYDFLEVEIVESGKKSFGVMFSSQMREYYRDKLEVGKDTSDIPIDIAFFRSIFRKESPDKGILDDYPLIIMPRTVKVKGELDAESNSPTPTHTYLSSLGLNMREIQPATSDHPFRVYYRNNFEDYESDVIQALLSTGQAMFEIVRPELYPLSDCRRPEFNMQYLKDVKWAQHNKARLWVNTHPEVVSWLLNTHKKIM